MAHMSNWLSRSLRHFKTSTVVPVPLKTRYITTPPKIGCIVPPKIGCTQQDVALCHQQNQRLFVAVYFDRETLNQWVWVDFHPSRGSLGDLTHMQKTALITEMVIHHQCQKYFLTLADVPVS